MTIVASQEEISAAWNACGGYEDEIFEQPRLEPRAGWFEADGLAQIGQLGLDHAEVLKRRHLMMSRAERQARGLPVERWSMPPWKLIAEGVAIGIKLGIEIGKRRN